jgi:protocatechuate 3,4-dioxygenase beta subunit
VSEHDDRPGGYLPRDRDWQPPALAPAYRTTVARSPRQPLLVFPTSPSEETGPVFGHSIIGAQDHDLLHNFARGGESAIGPRIVVHGQLRDQTGRAVPDALIEIWQANAGGRYRHYNETYIAPLDPNFGGCGRCITDASGHYEFHTVHPGAYPWPNGPNSWRPAHIHFSIFGQAFAQRLITQMYFEGDPLIPLCPIVNAIPHREGVDSLIARLDMEKTLPMDSLAYRFDIVLRGRSQTYFENRTEGL